MTTDYKAYTFIVDGDTVGYALVNHIREPLYLRQFYICRNRRRRGIKSKQIRSGNYLLSETIFQRKELHGSKDPLRWRITSPYSGRNDYIDSADCNHLLVPSKAIISGMVGAVKG